MSGNGNRIGASSARGVVDEDVLACPRSEVDVDRLDAADGAEQIQS